MFSLKSLIPACLLSLALPAAASAHVYEPAFPMLGAIMPRHASSLMLADFVVRPSLRPVLREARPIPHIRIRLNCVVQGTPVEFPDDLHIWSNYPVAAGAVAHWSLPGTNFSGSVVLPALAAGQHYFVPHALPGGWPAGEPCAAHLN